MLLLPYLNHAVRLLESGHAKREDIDKAARRARAADGAAGAA
jgi:3-hydroxyacyl-CoA dehydrogenase